MEIDTSVAIRRSFSLVSPLANKEKAILEQEGTWCKQHAPCLERVDHVHRVPELHDT